MELNILNLIDDAKCFEMVRDLRWPDGVVCFKCNCTNVKRRGFHNTQTYRQRYYCNNCNTHFDDLSNTIFAAHHQPLRVWMLSSYFMGLNLSNSQIAQELELNKDDVQKMTTQLREGIVEKKPEVILKNEVECDEVYIVASPRKRGAA